MLDFVMIALCVLVSVLVSLRFIHMLQLEGYQNKMYLKWLKRNWKRDWLPTILVFLVCVFCEASFPIITSLFKFDSTVTTISKAAFRLIYVALMSYIVYTWFNQPSKKPLNYTGRVKRLIATVLILIIGCNLLALVFKKSSGNYLPYLIGRITAYTPALFSPLLILIAAVINFPIEEGIKKSYFNQAKKILINRNDLLKIGITGSYGKTTTKFILGGILSEKFNVLITPQSYNTPMGVTRVAREMLRNENEVFVAEMGARYSGDIDELCELVNPSIGILCAVGTQHLETFGSKENIRDTKFELIASLPVDGAAFFNADNDICLELSHRAAAVENRYLYGIDCSENLFMRAINVAVGTQGSTFTLVARDGNKVECRTRLLGMHNILNITGAAAVAYYMGLTFNAIAAGIRRLEPVEHRLQLIPGPVTVIDDAFNSNPAGAKAAMDVLRVFEGRRIVVTPGMVELGDEEQSANEEFGRHIAKSCDFAILIGEIRSIPIKNGMEDGGFDMSKCFVVNSLEHATAVLANLIQPGDVVLFENDLPDNYSE